MRHPSRHALYLNVQAFDRIMAERGAGTPNKLAAHLGVGVGLAYRIRSKPVTGAFIAALVKEFDGDWSAVGALLTLDERAEDGQPDVKPARRTPKLSR